MSTGSTRVTSVMLGVCLFAGLARLGHAAEIQIHANAPAVAIGSHLEIELEYETGSEPVDVYAVILLPGGGFFSLLGAGQLSPPSTLTPLARSVTSPRVAVTLLDIEPLPLVPLGAYGLAAGLAVAGQPPLLPGTLVVSSMGTFSVTGGTVIAGGGGPGGSGCGNIGDEADRNGPEVRVISRITELVPPQHIRLASGHCVQVHSQTEFRTPLSGYASLSVSLLVEAEGHRQQDGDVLAKAVHLED